MALVSVERMVWFGEHGAVSAGTDNLHRNRVWYYHPKHQGGNIAPILFVVRIARFADQ